MDYGLAERNLRDMFRCLASGRARGEVTELPGLTIAAVGTAFQMFNTAFFSSPVLDRADLEERLARAAATFRRRKLSWSLWVCEELVALELRRRLARICERARLYPGPEMPAMAAGKLAGQALELPGWRIERVSGQAALAEFCRIGAGCFRVPPKWFGEIYDTPERLSTPVRGWVGYAGGQAVATAATVDSRDAIGLYNLATAEAFRRRGFGEAMSRHAVAETWGETGAKPVVLQATRQGLGLYERLGFQKVGRILVFPSL